MSAEQEKSEPKPRSIFRKEALEQLQSPEQLEQVLQVANRKSWLTLGVFGVFLIGILSWSVFGQIPVTVSGKAIVINPGRVVPVQVTHSGYLELLSIDPGTTVSAGDVIGKIRSVDPASGSHNLPEHPIISRYDGVVIERSVGPDNIVVVGQVIAYVEKSNAPSQLVVLAYFPENEGQQLSKGMLGVISPVTSAPEKDGNLLGEITEVSRYPVSFDSVVALVGLPEIAAKLTQEQPRIQATLALRPDDTAPSGYQWTSGKGPDLVLKSGTTAGLKITTGYIRPISYVVPFLKNTE